MMMTMIDTMVSVVMLSSAAAVSVSALSGPGPLT